MVPVYFKMFQLILNEKLSTSEVGSLILKNVPNLVMSRQNDVSKSEILPKEIYIKNMWNYMESFHAFYHAEFELQIPKHHLVRANFSRGIHFSHF